ncbi:exodeoxyribonuclease III [Candidatus Profftella armatura (Diaphorina cf. continua)]|uniref:Exodeoxyribonuclease III n=1 Tax=Candidatus Profftella armatura (Diaphorina cf. continua) TaxID=2661583 RepID=A0A7R6W110_9PROT|nr:exodeoxyribonuclease III [Candidatus Profftella armatura (Diaphorina cf. continua)]BCG49750.1 exodeoxyribonuclease III [Candidatus Profftella armatura (Diaphorina cf. continua)]
MKIATWNINSIKVRLPHILRWLTNNPDISILCLQETKITNDQFPVSEIESIGFKVIFVGQKSYNGVAILSRFVINNIIINNPYFPDKNQRLITCTIAGFRIICIYVPHGESLESPKYQYKLNWLYALKRLVSKELFFYKKLILLGDYNIAPEDCDVYNPVLLKNKITFSHLERSVFFEIQNLNFIDIFRLFHKEKNLYTWWAYRKMSFTRNIGLRLDHILMTPYLAKFCKSCIIDIAPRSWGRPSDHAPVIATLDISF